MKKIVSLIKATMTSGMSLFKIKTKNKRSQILVPLFIAGYLMFMVWGYANTMFEKLYPMHMQYLLLSMYVLSVSIMTFVEGIYKSGSLMYNCKDDDLLFSLPIPKRTILFIRILKFYLFELAFNSLFILPVMIAYIRWAENLNGTYFLASFIMLFLLPIIPIVLSCLFGAIISSVSSRLKHKNIAQTVVSMLFIVAILFISLQSDKALDYLVQHATSINDVITRIYYPAGVYVNLVTNFHIGDLLIFILVNILAFAITIYLLSIFYFKTNSKIKNVATSKDSNKKGIIIKKRSQTAALIKKELNTFFQTPVFIINSGFALVLYILVVIIICIKFEKILPILTSKEGGLGLSKTLINNNKSILIFCILSITAYMTSITNSVISLEGRNINILKSLPTKVKTILMSKIYACMVITTPILLGGIIVLSIKFHIGIIETILLLILSILVPLVSHFIGILVNLKYPKLDYENETEVIKQSTSSFLSVIIGMVLAVASVGLIMKIIGSIDSLVLLLIITIIYIILDGILYMYLVKKGKKEFYNLTI